MNRTILLMVLSDFVTVRAVRDFDYLRLFLPGRLDVIQPCQPVEDRWIPCFSAGKGAMLCRCGQNSAGWPAQRLGAVVGLGRGLLVDCFDGPRVGF